MTKIDCLVCHDTTGTYKKAPPAAGMPDPKVDLVQVAQHVGRPSRKTCGDCHFSGGGADAVKHADMSGVLYKPSREDDFHMGGLDFSCQECHRTKNHRIAGRSSSVAVVEGVLSCRDCHTDKPHYGLHLLDHHLNAHCEHIDCNTCHTPLYARGKPTKSRWDWSTAGDKKRKPKKDQYGKPDYHWKKGDFLHVQNAKPAYAWYDDRMKRYLVGDKVEDFDSVIKITEPVGDFRDPVAKITPFKIMSGKQAADPKTGYLLAPHLFGPGGYWKDLDWQKAFAVGMKAHNLVYSGEFRWVETEMFWRVEHGIAPREMSLTCVQCHPSLKEEKTCNRCHRDSRDVDFRKLATKGGEEQEPYFLGESAKLIHSTDYLDFKKLGYKGDPIVHGGRFKKLLFGN